MRKWGQHFLTDTSYISHILQDAEITDTDCILEIGPGTGALTRHYAPKTAHVLAVEIDPLLCKKLAHGIPPNVHIMQGDFLYVTEQQARDKLGDHFKIVANIPYYITSPILQKLYSWISWSSAILMVQKEVGERLCALPGSKAYGLLTILTHLYAKAEMKRIVPRKAFTPIPRVDSAVIKILKRDKPLMNEKEKEDLFAFLKICFCSRRKMIINTIAHGLSVSKQQLRPLFSETFIAPSRRPETISFEEYKVLHKAVKKRYNTICAEALNTTH